MKIVKPYLLLFPAVILLGACTLNQVAVVTPAAGKENVGTHCYSADDVQGHYLTAVPVMRAGMIDPPEAKATHTPGCGAVKFQVAADGKPFNVTVIREYPDGYGFGDAVADG